VFPLVLLLLPLWVTTHGRWRREWRFGLAALAAAFAIVVYGGYELGWDWTGFSGNHLWDWLEMLVLPFTVALLPFWLTAQRRPMRRHALMAAVVLAALATVIVCGYAVLWDWTGFQGNTLWDWMQLFIVPFAIPVAIAVLSVTAGLALEDERQGQAVRDTTPPSTEPAGEGWSIQAE
jgi:hypothetical protein